MFKQLIKLTNKRSVNGVVVSILLILAHNTIAMPIVILSTNGGNAAQFSSVRSGAQRSTTNIQYKYSLKENRDRSGRKIYAENEVVVLFKESVSRDEKINIIRQYALDAKTLIKQETKAIVVKLRKGQSISQAILQFKSDSNVKSVTKYYYERFQAVPNDPHYRYQWALKNTGQPIPNIRYLGVPPSSIFGFANADIGMEEAWNHITDCNVAVAIIDTGINYTHADLAPNMDILNMKDYLGGDSDAFPTSVFEAHGTHIAGIIGAVGNNSRGISGVCWKVKMIPIRIGDKDNNINQSQWGAAIRHAVDSGAKVINISTSVGAVNSDRESAITYALSKNVVIVAGAGNAGVNLDVPFGRNAQAFPCEHSRNYPNVICVTAIDQDFRFPARASWGRTSVNVAAPGTILRTTRIGKEIAADPTQWINNPNSGNWGSPVCSLRSRDITFMSNVLSNPAALCPDSNQTTANYANNSDDQAYQTFDLSKADQAQLIFIIWHSMELDLDFLRVRMMPTGGSPFQTVPGVIDGFTLKTYTGATELDAVGRNKAVLSEYYDLSSCLTATCSIGFRFISDATITSFGNIIHAVTIFTLERGSDAYITIPGGTSFAAPHVTGLAAMVFTWNPKYTAEQVINAIEQGGRPLLALANITTSGKVINAMGALKYIHIPVGVSVTLAP